MRKILVLAVSVLFCGTMAGQTRAADDVYVDLSVLDEIGGNSSSSAYGKPEPLFPVIRNTPQFPIVKKTTAEKKQAKVSKKAQTKKAVKKATATKKVEIKKAEKVVIPEKPKDIMPEPTKSEAASAQPKVQQEAKPIENTLALQPQASAESKSVDKESATENVSDVATATAPQSATQDMLFKVEKTTPTETITPAPVKEIVAEPVEQALQPEEKAEAKEEVMLQQPQPIEEKQVEPLVPVADVAVSEPKANIEQVKREIIFAEGSYELDDIAKEKIDAIIASFDDAKANKIAIMAYNYDNGEDVFRKKRQSLNRAIEIRSYLLGKGYKNFSIKVINITDDAAKGNVVEIDELK